MPCDVGTLIVVVLSGLAPYSFEAAEASSSSWASEIVDNGVSACSSIGL